MNRGDSLNWHIGQSLKKHPTVRLGLNPGIKDNHHSLVCRSPDQTSEALTKFDDGFRQLIFNKRITSASPDFIQPSFQQWMIRYSKRQLGNDHIGQCIARNIDTRPKTVRAKQNTTLALTK